MLFSNSLGYEYQSLSTIGQIFVGAGLTGELVIGGTGNQNGEGIAGSCYGLYGELGIRIPSGEGKWISVFLRVREGLNSSFGDSGDALLMGSSIMFGIGVPNSWIGND